MPRHNPYANVPTAPPELDLTAYAAGQEVELEIGFGRGHFILERAAERPEARLLGLEVRRKWVALTAQRAAQQGLTNVEVLLGNARLLLPNWQPAASLSAIFVNFPDPWWKKRHSKRRVVAAETVTQFARLLRPGGTFFLQTDVAERAEQYDVVLRQERRLRPCPATPERPLGANPLGVMSHREKKCAQAGLAVYRFFYQKV